MLALPPRAAPAVTPLEWVLIGLGIAIAVMVIGVIAAIAVAGLPERRRIAILTAQLRAEQEMDAATMQTLAAMRAAVRER